ncbi:MAG: SDR family oxidoreductase [Betaproteobacteria bacterium]
MNVFLTGGSSGIGAALARYYAGEGANVGLFARRAGALDALAAVLPAARVAVYPGDVRDASVLASAATDFNARFGLADVVIANAGVSRGTATELVEDLPVFEAVFATNVLGILHTFHPFLAGMRTARRGTLVGVASIAGYRGLPGSAAYSASKAAAINYLEALRVELVGSGVAVVTICPGYIATPMTAHNPYHMPFLMPAERAARLMARAIAHRRRFYVLPWQMALIGRLLRVLPRPLFDAAFAHAPRKPRAPG